MGELQNILTRYKVRNDLRRPSPVPRERISYIRKGWTPEITRVTPEGESVPYGYPEAGLAGVPAGGMLNRIISLRAIAYGAAAGARTVKTISDVIAFKARIRHIRIAFDYNDPWADGVRLFAMTDESAPSGVVPVTGKELIECFASATGVSPTEAQKSQLLTDPQGIGRLNMQCDIPVMYDRWRLYLYYNLLSGSAGIYYNAVAQIDVEEESEAAAAAGLSIPVNISVIGSGGSVSKCGAMQAAVAPAVTPKVPTPKEPVTYYSGDYYTYDMWALYSEPTGVAVGVRVWRRHDVGEPAAVKGGVWKTTGETTTKWYAAGKVAPETIAVS